MDTELPANPQFNDTVYNTTTTTRDFNLFQNMTTSSSSSSLDDLLSSTTVATTTINPNYYNSTGGEGSSSTVFENFTTTAESTLQNLTTIASMTLQNLTMSILNNLTSSSPSPSSFPFLRNGGNGNGNGSGGSREFQDFTTHNYSEYLQNSLQDEDNNNNGTDIKPKKYSAALPGKSEVVIIIAIVFVLLYIAAKYIGCTLSHWPFFSRCFKSRDNNYSTGVTGTTPSATHLGNRYRQEYSRRDIHYAVYSRPTTAYPRPMTAYPGSGGLGLSAGFQDPRFSYNSSFDMDDMDHCKVVVNGDSEDTELPPAYDSIVPNYSTQSRYTYSSTR